MRKHQEVILVLLFLQWNWIAEGLYLTFPAYNSAGSCGNWSEGSYYMDTENDPPGLSYQIGGSYPRGTYDTNGVTFTFCTGVISSIPSGSFCFYQNALNSIDCPSGFTAGSRTHNEENTSNQSHLYGSKANTPKLVLSPPLSQWFFCCRSDATQLNTVVSFDAIQPQLPDKFVLIRSGGKCQEINGRIASEGYIEVQDEVTNGNDQVSGSLPDGIYTSTTTRYNYCSYSDYFLPDPIISLQIQELAPDRIQFLIPNSNSVLKKLSFKEISQTDYQWANATANLVTISGFESSTTYQIVINTGAVHPITGVLTFETVGYAFQFTTCSSGTPSCIPTCSSSCVNGVCTSTNTCTCFASWTGSTCGDPICDPPCTNGGTCTAPNTCSCSLPWIGPLCDQCTSSYYYSLGSCLACPNCHNGVCSDGFGDGSCVCNQGFTTPPLSTDYCTTCLDGYFLFGSSCFSCNPNCKTCGSNADHCLRCESIEGLKNEAILELKSYCVSECNDQCKEIIEKYQGMECFEELKDSIGELFTNSQKSCCESNQLTCESSSTLSGGAIAGIIIGIFMGIALIASVLVFIYWRKSRKKEPKNFVDYLASDSNQEIESSKRRSRTSFISMFQMKSRSSSRKSENLQEIEIDHPSTKSNFENGKTIDESLASRSTQDPESSQKKPSTSFISKFQKKSRPSSRKNESFQETQVVDDLTMKTIVLGDITLMNTSILEVAIPGFLNIDFINQIRKEEKIGGGGFATIYKGVILDSKLSENNGFKEVAIKELFEKQNISQEDFKQRFEQEIAIMWAISSHPNIITLVGYSENPYCIITKLYDQDLHDYIKNMKEDIPTDIIVKFSSDIASGMNMIHSSGIVHRDLKSSNILIKKEKKELNAVICDFGLAGISSEKNILNQKMVDVKGFSPRYTAPEVFGRMTSSITTATIEHEMKSDVYPYALILWEMMTRKIPWAHLEKTEDIELKVRSGNREEIPDTNGDKDLELISTLIESSWHQNPDKRPTFQRITQKLQTIS